MRSHTFSQELKRCKNMLTRIISGAWYMGLLALAYLLKIFVPQIGGVAIGDFFVDILIYVFALVGTFEMVRALKDRLTKAEQIVAYSFALLCIPIGVVMKTLLDWGITSVGFCVIVLTVALLSLLVFQHDKTSLESVGLTFLASVYPTVFLSVMMIANHAQVPSRLEHFAFDSRLLVLFIFLLVPAVDSFAYLFGRFLGKKFPKKMAPVLSPKKTVVGCIGGVIGGLVCATVIYFVYNALLGSYDLMHIWLPVYLLIGFLTSLATIFGDLVESCIKRKLYIKDMGDLMPGHGGILARIDSALFASIAVYVVYALIAWVVYPMGGI